jgi:enoyl-CoA hydratase
MSDTVTATTEGDVTVIRIDDGKANALTFDLLDGVAGALESATTTSKAVAIIGREGKFSAGFDLSVMTGGDLAAARDLLAAGARLGLQVFMAPVPVVLGVTGHAIAMGGILTTCADYRVGAEGPYKIGLNEVANGMPVPRFAVEMCRDRLTNRWYTRCVQAAHMCSPAEALEAGFLDEVRPLDEVADRTIEVATELAAYVHPGPFRLTRTNVRGRLADELDVGLEEDLKLFAVGS